LKYNKKKLVIKKLLTYIGSILNFKKLTYPYLITSVLGIRT